MWEHTEVISSSDFVNLSFVSLLEDYPFSVRSLFYLYFMAVCIVRLTGVAITVQQKVATHHVLIVKYKSFIKGRWKMAS